MYAYMSNSCEIYMCTCIVCFIKYRSNLKGNLKETLILAIYV